MLKSNLWQFRFLLLLPHCSEGICSKKQAPTWKSFYSQLCSWAGAWWSQWNSTRQGQGLRWMGWPLRITAQLFPEGKKWNSLGRVWTWSLLFSSQVTVQNGCVAGWVIQECLKKSPKRKERETAPVKYRYILLIEWNVYIYQARVVFKV